MTPKTSFWRNLGIGALAGLAGLVGGCGSNGKLVDTETLRHPYVETAVVTDYVAKHGMAVRGQVRQDTVSVNINDRLSVFMWQDYSHHEGEFNERDFGLAYNLPVNDKLSVSTGYQHWGYPSGTFGKYDTALKFGASYKDFIDLKFDVTQLLPTDTTPHSGTRYYLQASKTFPIGKMFGTDVSITPSISTAIVDNYYGRDGHSQVTPGLNLGFNKGNWSLNFFINKQDALIPGFEDFTWSGMSLGVTF